MGDTFGEGYSHELPVHAVYVDAFYMDVYEVTNERYCTYLNSAYGQGLIHVSSGIVYKAGGTSYPYCDTTSSSSYSRITWNGSTFGITTGKEDHPMLEVSWYGAVAYSNWRSDQDGRTPCYDLDHLGVQLLGERLSAGDGGRVGEGGPGRYAGAPLPVVGHGHHSACAGKLLQLGRLLLTTQAQRATITHVGVPGGYPHTSPVGFFTGALQYKADWGWRYADELPDHEQRERLRFVRHGRERVGVVSRLVRFGLLQFQPVRQSDRPRQWHVPCVARRRLVLRRVQLPRGESPQELPERPQTTTSGFVAWRGPCSIETVTIGNPGNSGELSGEGAGGYGPDRICGAVDYVYNIGKYEVTAGQYAEFLNAVADTDTYGLYNTSMWSSSYGCKIERSGSSGSYTYSVAGDWADRPVNYVSWGDAARFANWLHNGQPSGDQDLTTTEDGSYYLNGATSNAALLAVDREPDATWVIPSEDEWYKAAYHKNDGVTGNYWDYPTSTSSVPSNDLIDPDPGNHATFYDGGYTIGSPYYRTEVGAHENSDSPYGTFDQGGNVCEWNEAILYDSYRGLRGGSFYSYDYYLHAANRSYYYYPTFEYDNIGFRVSQVP